MNTLRYMILVAGAAMTFAACNKTAEQDLLPDSSSGKVSIVFGIGAAGSQSATKAMAELPQITDLRIAVFGGSGYLKEYVKAWPVDEDGNDLTEDAYLYNRTGKAWFRADLTPSDSRLRVHFIANGPETLPFKYEEDVIKALYTGNPRDGYWQRIIVPHGIQAKTDTDGDYVDADGNKITSSTQAYVVSDETEAAFQDIALIRNFAKIKVEVSEDANFTLKGFLVANVPDRGALAAYDGEAGRFIANYYPGSETAQDNYNRSYNDFSYNEIAALYPGYSVDGTEILPIVTEETTASSFLGATEAAFVYERPRPTSLPTVVIVYGTYNGSDYYYKLNITDTNYENIPILRNYLYTVTLSHVSTTGYDTAIEAYNGSGSGGISSSTEATELVDISDGTSRIQTEYIERVLTGGESTTISFQFTRSTTAGYQDGDNDYVTISLGEANATGAVFAGDPVIAENDGADHWRLATLPLAELGEQAKVQTVRVSGLKPDGTHLYRDITYRLMPKMNLAVRVPDEVAAKAGTSLIVQLGLPKNIPSSIFPLPVKIESDAQTINPDHDNLPVESGSSIVAGREDKRSFAFVKTISYSEYKAALATSTDDKVWFDCRFKTVVDASACTVYAANTYFNTASDSFVTYSQQYFTNLSFSDTLTEEGQTFDFSFNLDTVVPDYVTVTLFGAAPVDDSQLHPVPNEPGVYTYLPAATETSVTLHLITTNSYVVASAGLAATHYESAECKVALSFTGLNLAYYQYAGTNKPVTFTFSYASGIITPVTLELKGLAPAATETRLTANSDGTYTFTPSSTAAGNETQSIQLVTTNIWNDNMSVSLNALMDGLYWTASTSARRTGTFTIEKRTIQLAWEDTATASSALFLIFYPDNTYSTTNRYTDANNQSGHNSFFVNYNGVNKGKAITNYSSTFTLDISNPTSNTVVYLRFGRISNGIRRSSITLGELLSGTTDDPYILDFSGIPAE